MDRLPKSFLLKDYARDINFRQPLFVLDSYKKTDFRNSIFSALRESGVFYRGFDPVETPRLSTPQLIGDITSSGGIVLPVFASQLFDSSLHNLRVAYIAGLAHGLGRMTLLIRHGLESELGPADFRDEIKCINKLSEVVDIVEPFAKEAVVAAQRIEPLVVEKKSTALRSISLGAVAAENEFRSLAQYFVATSEFSRTVKGEINVVTGRKGSGKSAIFFRAADVMGGRKDFVVVDRAPESHRLIQFRTELSGAFDVGMVDHTLAAFWYFILLSEILLTLRRSAERRYRFSTDAYKLVVEADEALGDYLFLKEGDFTTRLSRLTRAITHDIKTSRSAPNVTIQNITNLIYSRYIPSVRQVILNHTTPDTTIAFVFDNIDKGWPSSGVERLDIKIVRTLLESLTKIRQDLSRDNRTFQSTSFCEMIFLKF